VTIAWYGRSHMAQRMFGALVKHWRARRGLSQLDLALAAGVSARHLSFLETGRAKPSEEMVLRLADVLDVPLRDRNLLLEAAGLPARFAQHDVLPAAVELAIDRMLAAQEPYPLLVMSSLYEIVRRNRAATRLIDGLVATPEARDERNLYALLFDPRALRPSVIEWDALAARMLARLQREALVHADDPRRRELLARVGRYPGVPRSQPAPDLSMRIEPTLVLRLRWREVALSFLTTVTVFSAPQEVAIEELRIESFFPLDDTTASACAEIAAGA
jgi:transcriptional regulator with XRE-family HTH domain